MEQDSREETARVRIGQRLQVVLGKNGMFRILRAQVQQSQLRVAGKTLGVLNQRLVPHECKLCSGRDVDHDRAPHRRR